MLAILYKFLYIDIGFIQNIIPALLTQTRFIILYQYDIYFKPRAFSQKSYSKIGNREVFIVQSLDDLLL